jgi:hypothetical protein
MTFEQINSACRGGKPPKGVTAGSFAEAVEIARDMKANWRKYYGV